MPKILAGAGGGSGWRGEAKKGLSRRLPVGLALTFGTPDPSHQQNIMPSRVGPLPVLFLTGAPGCGKGSVCHWLEKECGFFVVTVDEAASSTVRGVECVFDDALRRAGDINIDIDVMPICVSALPSRLIFERFQNAVSCTAPLNAFAASARRGKRKGVRGTCELIPSHPTRSFLFTSLQ